MSIIPFVEELLTGIQGAENNFYDHPDNFPALETEVVDLTNRLATQVLGYILTQADEMIRDSGIRDRSYTIQRRRPRTLVSSVGDIYFERTLYKDRDGRSRYLLDEVIQLPHHERFTVPAEARLLNEAEVHSYQHAADSIRSASQKITKTTVMNKVHAIEAVMPDAETEDNELRKAEYLYIEADEDHIHRQKDGENTGCFIGKLAYVFEGKEDICKGRKALVFPHYFGGIYNGTENNKAFWEGVQTYIETHYDLDVLKQVYVSGDGAPWIKAATDYIDQSVFVADRFHLMEYIHRVAGHAEDERDVIVGQLYKSIYKNKLSDARKTLSYVGKHYEKSANAVKDLRRFMNRNWESIQRAFHDEHVLGCSAEGHESCIFSERLSSRPMGWSEKGADHMCKFRCFVRNYGRDKVVDLVCWRRQHELGELAATGTDGLISVETRKHYSGQQKKDRGYIERLQATLQINSKVRKTIAIRERISMI